jgi:hypothetical protein
VSLDDVYDCPRNRKALFKRGMAPSINPNPRGRKWPRRGRKPRFDPAIFEERFRTIERVFAWEDKFRRLLKLFERLSHLHDLTLPCTSRMRRSTTRSTPSRAVNCVASSSHVCARPAARACRAVVAMTGAARSPR